MCEEEVLDLVLEGENVIAPGLDECGVDGRTAVGHVVREQGGGVVGCG